MIFIVYILLFLLFLLAIWLFWSFWPFFLILFVFWWIYRKLTGKKRKKNVYVFYQDFDFPNMERPENPYHTEPRKALEGSIDAEYTESEVKE